MFHPVELLHEWETRTNRLWPRGHGLASLDSHWSLGSGERLALQGVARPSPQLMVVLMTYQRPDSAAHVLSQLAAALRQWSGSVSLLVLRDAGDADYAAARAQARAIDPEHVWFDARQRFGKAGFWRMHQTALDVARLWQPERALYLQDDLAFSPELLRSVDQLWQATEIDAQRRVLYLFSSRDDEPEGRWVRYQRRDVPGAACRLTNWFDLQAFLIDRRGLELLDYRMVPVHPNRWRRRPAQSSGVGRQLSLRLFGRGHVYQAWPPLVVHGTEQSTMNPEARSARSLDNRDDYTASSDTSGNDSGGD